MVFDDVIVTLSNEIALFLRIFVVLRLDMLVNTDPEWHRRSATKLANPNHLPLSVVRIPLMRGEEGGGGIVSYQGKDAASLH